MTPDQSNSDKNNDPPEYSSSYPAQVLHVKNPMPAWSNSFNYWSLSIGIGLVVTGSILIYIFRDQALYYQDTFNSSLKVTAGFFIVLGILLITTSVVKIIALRMQANPDKACLPCCLDVSVENDMKQLPLNFDNTIVYNPMYPPILIPYTTGGAKSIEEKLYSRYMPDSNLSVLPGSLGLNLEKQFLEEDEVGKTKSDIFVLSEQNVENNEDGCNCYEDGQTEHLKEDKDFSSDKRFPMEKY